MAKVREYRCVRLLGVLSLFGTLLFTLVAPAPFVAAAPGGNAKVEVTDAVHHDLSPPLRDLPNAPPPSVPPREIPLLTPPINASPSTTPDPVVNVPLKDKKVGTTAGVNVAGVGQGDYGYTEFFIGPPDTTGAVGATQYVQWVNTAFAVFNKSTGAIVSGFPKYGNTLWHGFGGGCEVNNDGSPIVLYDKAAGRWFLTQLSTTSHTTEGYLQCVAVSTSSDATGAYNRYSFAYSPTAFNDNGRAGVWPDGYYTAYNVTDMGFGYARACAFDRTRMLAGLSATQQCISRGQDHSLLPSDLDGTTPPPAGSPNFFLKLDNDSQSLDLFKFHVDWATPANTTFTGPTNIPVAAFTVACVVGGSCIPQPGTSIRLDSLTNRLMFRLAYRNFGDHESLVVNHSVTANSVAAVRWYEIRDPNGTPTVYQQQAYGGDTVHRWAGSIAMDQLGDMALGYSMSSGTVYPQIVYTGRLASDPLGTMQGENLMKGGAGSESSTTWGNDSAMTVDPVDDCTFWYTNEYLKFNGDFWSTQIASFKFPNCGTVTPPPTPTGLAATGSTYNSVTWSWSNPDPTAYVAVNDGTNTFGLAAGTTSYTKYGVAYGGYAGIRIAAFHDINHPSPFTPYVFGLTTPIIPYNPHTTGATTSAVSFGWNNYDSVSQIAVSDGSMVSLLGTNATAYTKMGIASGYYACVSVEAYNAAHASGWSPYACGYTLPTTPNLPSASTHTASSVTFVWTNHDPYSYIALTNGGAVQALGQNVTTYTQSGMTAGQYACIKVAAYNFAGASVYTATWACGQAT